MPIEELNSYYCEECEKWTYIEELHYCVYCAYCGEEGINKGSKTYEKLRKKGTDRQ